jgi:hypothetical protein
MPALEIPAGINAIRVNGRNAPGDGLGGLFVDVDNGSSETFTTADGRTWYRAADVGLSRVGDGLGMAIRPDFSSIHQVAIDRDIPIRFSSYAAVVETYNYSFLNPQGVVLDEDRGIEFMFYNPNDDNIPAPNNRWCWIVARDFETGNELCYFSAGIIYNEGGYIRRIGSNVYLETKSASSDEIGRYDITALPINGTRLTAVATFPVAAQSQMCGRNGIVLSEKFHTTRGTRRTKANFLVFSGDDYTVAGEIDFSQVMSGSATNTPTDRAVPKAQGIALADGYIVRSMGGFWGVGDSVDGYGHFGIRVHSFDGKQIASALYDPSSIAAHLQSRGYVVNRVEAEGVIVTDNGRVYSYLQYSGGAPGVDLSGGMLRIEHFSRQPGAEDWSKLSVYTPSFDASAWQVQGLQRGLNTGEPVNPLTGSVFAGLNDVLDFMVSQSLGSCWFYAQNFLGIKDLIADAFPAFSTVQIFNDNNNTFQIRAFSTNEETQYTVSGSPRTQTKVIVRGKGTFTPNLLFGGANTGLVQTSSNGRWRRNGDIVTVDFYVQLSSKGSAVGAAKLSGLPVAALTTAIAVGDVMPQNMASLPSAVHALPTPASEIELFGNNAGGRVALTDANFTATSILRGSVSYIVA